MRLHVLEKWLLLQPDEGLAGRSLWIDRDKMTMEVADRQLEDLSRAKSMHIQCVAGVVKCVFGGQQWWDP